MKNFLISFIFCFTAVFGFGQGGITVGAGALQNLQGVMTTGSVLTTANTIDASGFAYSLTNTLTTTLSSQGAIRFNSATDTYGFGTGVGTPGFSLTTTTGLLGHDVNGNITSEALGNFQNLGSADQVLAAARLITGNANNLDIDFTTGRFEVDATNAPDITRLGVTASGIDLTFLSSALRVNGNAGIAGQVLMTQGATTAPLWATLPDEVIENAGALTGAAPNNAQWGINTTDGSTFYVSGGNWTGTPAGTNIYTADGTLTGARTMTMAGNNLTMTGGNLNLQGDIAGERNFVITNNDTGAGSEARLEVQNSTHQLNFFTTTAAQATFPSVGGIFTDAANGFLVLNGGLQSLRTLATGQLQLAQYTDPSDFPGTAVGLLGYDVNGNITTEGLSGTNTNLFTPGGLTNTVFVANTDDFGWQITGTGQKILTSVSGANQGQLATSTTSIIMSHASAGGTASMQLATGGGWNANSSVGSYNFSTLMPANSDGLDNILSITAGGAVQRRNIAAHQTLVNNGTPVGTGATAFHLGQIYIDDTTPAAPVLYYATTAATDPDVGNAGSVFTLIPVSDTHLFSDDKTSTGTRVHTANDNFTIQGTGEKRFIVTDAAETHELHINAARASLQTNNGANDAQVQTFADGFVNIFGSAGIQLFSEGTYILGDGAGGDVPAARATTEDVRNIVLDVATGELRTQTSSTFETKGVNYTTTATDVDKYIRFTAGVANIHSPAASEIGNSFVIRNATGANMTVTSVGTAEGGLTIQDNESLFVMVVAAGTVDVTGGF